LYIRKRIFLPASNLPNYFQIMNNNYNSHNPSSNYKKRSADRPLWKCTKHDDALCLGIPWLTCTDNRKHQCPLTCGLCVPDECLDPLYCKIAVCYIGFQDFNAKICPTKCGAPQCSEKNKTCGDGLLYGRTCEEVVKSKYICGFPVTDSEKISDRCCATCERLASGNNSTGESTFAPSSESTFAPSSEVTFAPSSGSYPVSNSPTYYPSAKLTSSKEMIDETPAPVSRSIPKEVLSSSPTSTTTPTIRDIMSDSYNDAPAKSPVGMNRSSFRNKSRTKEFHDNLLEPNFNSYSTP